MLARSPALEAEYVAEDDRLIRPSTIQSRRYHHRPEGRMRRSAPSTHTSYSAIGEYLFCGIMPDSPLYIEPKFSKTMTR